NAIALHTPASVPASNTARLAHVGGLARRLCGEYRCRRLTLASRLILPECPRAPRRAPRPRGLAANTVLPAPAPPPICEPGNRPPAAHPPKFARCFPISGDAINLRRE